jgi:hypothetical protein
LDRKQRFHSIAFAIILESMVNRPEKNIRRRGKGGVMKNEEKSAVTRRINDASQRRDDAPGESDDFNKTRSSWQLLRSHPTFFVLIFLVIPWLLSSQAKNAYIRYPHTINQILDTLEDAGIYHAGYRLRPPLGMNETRQLLIVGSMSSGTRQAAHDLVESLGLEVGHEDSDTTHYAVRDGSVSWFHGIRFLDRPDPQERLRTMVDICKVSWRIYSYDKIQWNYPWSNYGTDLIIFGPTNFSLPHFHPNFKKAYLQTCQQTIFRELGCELSQTCRGAPFQRIMLQTREPWRIVTSLVTKYCGGGKWEAPTSLLMLFQAIYPNSAQVWFPKESKEQEKRKSESTALRQCSEQMAMHVYLWYSDLLESFDKLRKSDTESRPNKSETLSNYMVYPIERTTICQVAAMAGFNIHGDYSNNDLVVYPPNIESVASFCKESPNVLFGNTQNQFNSKNNNNEVVPPKNGKNPIGEFEEQKLGVATVRDVMSEGVVTMIDGLSLRMGYDV